MAAKKIIGAVLGLGITFGFCVFVYAITNNKVVIGYNQNYEPTQPIPYSHALHAGKLGLNCKYCHTTAEISRHASVPPLNVCMNCHLTVRQVNGKDSPYIAQLVDAYMIREVDKGWLWADLTKCPIVNLDLAKQLKPGQRVDIVGISAGRDLSQSPGLVFSSCYVLITGSLQLPAPGGPVFTPTY